MVKTIFRVETPNGVGPYANDSFEYPIPVKLERHPNLATEGREYSRPFYALKDKGESMRFGFARQEQLITWFNATERKKLKKLGYVIQTYNLPDDAPMVVSPRQCAFARKFAERGEVVAWDSLPKRKRKTDGQLDLFDIQP